MRALQLGDTLAAANTANADAAKTSLSLADTTLSQVTSIVTQIQTLATQAASGTLNDAQRAGVGVQIGQLQQNLVALANTTDTNGTAVFGGSGAGKAYTLDASGNATYTGGASANTVALGGGLTVTTGVTGPQVFNYTDKSGAPQNLLSVISNLATALQTPGGAPTPQAAAKTALDQLSSGLAQVTTAQTIIGARENWVTTTTTIQTQLDQQRASTESNVGDTDIAAAVSRLQQATTVLTAAQATFVKVAGMSLFSMLQ
jgi:flagellar hook-associated protein 3 FlgL